MPIYHATVSAEVSSWSSPRLSAAFRDGQPIELTGHEPNDPGSGYTVEADTEDAAHGMLVARFQADVAYDRIEIPERSTIEVKAFKKIADTIEEWEASGGRRGSAVDRPGASS